jgi:hypothetical protein
VVVRHGRDIDSRGRQCVQRLGRRLKRVTLGFGCSALADRRFEVYDGQIRSRQLRGDGCERG